MKGCSEMTFVSGEFDGWKFSQDPCQDLLNQNEKF